MSPGPGFFVAPHSGFRPLDICQETLMSKELRPQNLRFRLDVVKYQNLMLIEEIKCLIMKTYEKH